MGATFTTLSNELQTFDGLPQPAGSFDIPPNSTAIVDITVVARALDGTSKVFFHKSLLNRVPSGEVQITSLINNSQNVINDVAATFWSFEISANLQGQIQLTYTGATGVTIDWRHDGSISFFQPEG